MIAPVYPTLTGRTAMTDRIPARIVETLDPARPVRLSPARDGSPIHTRSVTGRFRNRRLYGAGLLLLLFFGIPWLSWNGRQAVLWDLAGRKPHIFGATYWPQDFILLSTLLIDRDVMVNTVAPVWDGNET
jgi:hypothetical protein